MQANDEPNINFRNVGTTLLMAQRNASLARHALDNLDDDALAALVIKAVRDRPWRVFQLVIAGLKS